MLRILSYTVWKRKHHITRRPVKSRVQKPHFLHQIAHFFFLVSLFIFHVIILLAAFVGAVQKVITIVIAKEERLNQSPYFKGFQKRLLRWRSQWQLKIGLFGQPLKHGRKNSLAPCGRGYGWGVSSCQYYKDRKTLVQNINLSEISKAIYVVSACYWYDFRRDFGIWRISKMWIFSKNCNQYRIRFPDGSALKWSIECPEPDLWPGDW